MKVLLDVRDDKVDFVWNYTEVFSFVTSLKQT